jgi:hypothetical protein
MSHPAKQINKTSYQIVNGEYDEAIVSLTNTLKTLKLVLSGDAKILGPTEMEENDDSYDDCDAMDESESSSSSTDSFEYDFFSSPTSSSFLKTAVSVKGRSIHSSCISNRSDDYSSSCSTSDDSAKSSSTCSVSTITSANCPQHQLQVSIFRDPIMVRGDHFKAPLDIQVCEELSYVAIYNLALSHHLKSVELASHPSKQNLRRVYLHKALSLYEHSHQILMKQMINVGVPVIHSMALVSNLSQIHHALGDHNKADMCMQYLLSTMMYVIDCGKVETLGNSMDGFFNMILPLISGDVPAPAA